MDGDGERSSPKPEETGADLWKKKNLKSKSLKIATSHLRAEALRRYRLKHSNDPEYVPPDPQKTTKITDAPHIESLVHHSDKKGADEKWEIFPKDKVLPPIKHQSIDKDETRHGEKQLKDSPIKGVNSQHNSRQINNISKEMLQGPNKTITSHEMEDSAKSLNSSYNLKMKEGPQENDSILDSTKIIDSEETYKTPISSQLTQGKFVEDDHLPELHQLSQDKPIVIYRPSVNMVNISEPTTRTEKNDMFDSSVQISAPEKDAHDPSIHEVEQVSLKLKRDAPKEIVSDPAAYTSYLDQIEIEISDEDGDDSSEIDSKPTTDKTDLAGQNIVEEYLVDRKEGQEMKESTEDFNERRQDTPEDNLTFDITRECTGGVEAQKQTEPEAPTGGTEQTVEPKTEGDQVKPEETSEAPKESQQEIKPEGENVTETQKVEEQAPETQKVEEQAPEAQKVEEQAPETQKVEEQAPETQKVEEKAPETQKVEEQAPEAQKVEEQAPETQKVEEQAPETQKVEEEAPETQKVEEQAPETQKVEEQAPETEQAPEAQKVEEQAPETQKQEEQAPETQQQEEQKAPETETQQQVEPEQKEQKQAGGEGDAEQKEKEDGQKIEDTNQSAKEGIEEEKEEDETEEKKEKKKEVKLIPEDFHYEFDNFVSKAVVTEGSGLPEDMLKLQHSFGYDCTKRNNLHLLDDHTLCFAAGNLVQLLDINTKEQKYLRSTSGGGIGAITVHPSQKYFAVAEKGHTPNINIFEYPSLKLYRVLRGGTEKSYSSLDFSPDGNLLASLGGDPDFMLTLWEWKQEQTVLRSKAFSQDVFTVTFSTELEGQLTTAGTSHIRFWKMADTFTGLKLQGQLGKFGRTEITDIEGYVELPDGKVLSGAEWGNMLLWEGGLIKVEIIRKGKKSCHHGPIQQILLDEGELITVGSDGFIRVWDFESIDTADTTDESATFEMEPMNELKVGSDVNLRSIKKCTDAENEITVWYAQDANGGIWKLDLSFSHTSSAPEKIFTYHAGAILGCDTSPESHLIASTGADHTVRLFDYVQRKQICEKKYAAKGTSLLWAPKIVDTKVATVIAGFQDGVVRVLALKQMNDEALHSKRHKNSVELDILQAFKPHNKAVTSIAIDHSGDILATGGEDSSIFFMAINGQTYDPIGFVQTPTAVRKIQWSPSRFKKSSLLVFCEEGYVLEIESPEEAKFDTSHTFHITGLAMKQYKFRSIKSKVRHEEDLERRRIEEADRKRKEEEERRRRIERGLETESEQGDEPEEGKKEKEEEWKAYIPEIPSPILTGYYSDEGRFWLSMGEFDSGYLYECKFMGEAEKTGVPEELHDEPIRYVPVLGSEDIPIENITFSSNGKQAIFGMQNGALRIHSLDIEFDISSINHSWRLNVHDNNYGHITGVKLGYDSLHLLSVGGDGNFFMFDVMTQENIDQKVAEAKAKLPSAKKKDDDKIGDDIDDPSAYSIEDAKQKAEYDKMMKLAEEKKREVRRQISKFRRQFKGLLEKNEGLPNNLQLKKEEFEMDREIKEELQKQRDERIEIVRKELAWESEKQRIALEKLRKRYKDVVECERIVVIAFKTKHEVASFRAAKLSDDFYHMKADFERRKTNMTRDDFTRDPTRELLTGQTRLTDMGTGAGGKAEDPTAKVTTMTTLKGSMGERITKALGKVEEKKKKRAQRKAQWDDLYNTKPDDDFEDPKDLSAIKEARDNMGYFNLKTAKDYIVPDHLRMNVEKARGRLLILKDLIHEYKYNFNLKLLSLRDKKIRIIEEIKDICGNLKNVHENLEEPTRKTIPPVPEMHIREMPERKLEYTQETLIKFKKEFDEKQKLAVKGSAAGGFGGFGGFGGETKAASPTPLVRRMSEAKPKTESASSETLEDVELTPLEIELKQIEDIRMIYEQDRLLKRIEELVTNFDAELRILRHDKFKLDIVMKNADLRQVTLFEELVLLKEYEKREDLLAEKVTSKAQEKIDMQNKLVDITSKIELKKKEIEKLGEKDRALNAQFLVLLGDKNQWAEYLTKVYKKKIKRAKKKVSEDDEDEESDDDSDDDSEWDEDEDESDDDAGGYDLDICPQGCDQTLYDSTCAMREKRLDIEEALSEEKKNNEALKKELESMNKKLKVIINALKTAQNDLEAFQLEKQQKLNELDVVVTLKLHQIQYMINGVLPQDLSQTLVFESNGVARLQQRIKELEHEKSLQKKQMKEARKTHVTLIKDRKIFDAKIGEMEEQTNEMMVAKFGRIVDLEKLETITVNRAIEELKEKLRMTEIQCSEEMTEWDDKIREKKNRITSLIRDNTNRLDQLNVLMNEQKLFEKSLDSRQKNLGEEYSGARKADVHEKQRLIQLVQLQAQEIDALKEEIMLLSRKGGHILPPAQPPLPQSPANLRPISN